MYRMSRDFGSWPLVRSIVAGKAREELFDMLCKRSDERTNEVVE
jgi:hypothetical protein